MSLTSVVLEPVSCPRCPTQVAPSLLACPGCGALMRSEDLKRLAGEAAEAGRSGDLRAEAASWRRALELLPPGSEQHRIITGKLQELSRRIETTGDLPPPSAAEASSPKGASRNGTKAGVGAAVVAIGVLLLKSKGLLVLLLTKAKFLLLGLTKLPTLGSMFLSLSVYWTLWGWKFAVGIIASIYVHEMGHVAAYRKFGLRTTAPMFVPGLGAFVGSPDRAASPREDARIGLAGPVWGLGAAMVAYTIYFATGIAFWAAIARVGAWINLFNLAPVFGLDGSYGFRALTRVQRLVVAGAFGTAWLFVHDGLLLLLAIVAGGVALSTKAAEEPDHQVLIEYLGLILTLSAMLMIPLKLEAAGLR